MLKSHPTFHSLEKPRRGQGLVEYALLLALVAVIAAGILLALGSVTGEKYDQVRTELGDLPGDEFVDAGGDDPGDTDDSGPTDTVAIVMADYNPHNQHLQLRATSNGGYNPAATLTATPGGTMNRWGVHGYQLNFFLTQPCPCTVTVTSSQGGSASVVVEP